MGAVCGETVNSAVTKLLILLVVNSGVNEGELCADALSASHAGRRPTRAAADTWSKSSPACQLINGARVSRRGARVCPRGSREPERDRIRSGRTQRYDARTFLGTWTVRLAERRSAGSPDSSRG
ncbi:hypothetical protein GCM10010206_36350 [Streptomyces cinerochromogenes]|nr:hypothetical protein GCM10010206_36350 [Streptomyces cinerochromogenes]